MEVARPKRFELLTPRFVVWCSIQLSYGRVAGIAKASDRRWQGFRPATRRPRGFMSAFVGQRPVPNAFAYSSGLKPTMSLPPASSTGRLIIDGCAAISAIAFVSLRSC
jgi:hypothetical protein